LTAIIIYFTWADGIAVASAAAGCTDAEAVSALTWDEDVTIF
jgi:hypothetical protein